MTRSGIPYDDTGWTFGELFNVKVVRVTDVKVLDASLEPVKGELTAPGSVTGTGSIFAINHNADPSLATLRYRFRDAQIDVAEEAFEAEGQKFNRGSFIIRGGISAADLSKATADLGLKAVGLQTAPAVQTHPAKAARVAVLHTWINTQDEGWWRLALDQIAIPYTYMNTQDVAQEANLRSRYDVILFPPVGRGAGQQIITGLPMYGNPLPWKTTELTPNIGKIDSTDDMRPGLGWQGLSNLQKFVRDGGVLVTVDDTSNFAIQFGLTAGVSVTPAQRLKITGRGPSLQVSRRRQPARLRIRGEPLDLLLGRSDLQRQQHARRPWWPRRRGRTAARDGPRHARRARPAAGAGAVRAPAAGPEGRGLAGHADSRRAAPKRHQHHPAGTAASRRVALRRRARPARRGPARRRRRDRPAPDGCRRAGRQGPRDPLLEQPDLAWRDARELLPRAECHPQPRQPQRRAQAGRALTMLLQDVKYAVRTLARTPAFTLVAVLTLALGIGATTAIFSVVHGVLMKPLPYRDPDRLANIWVDLGVGNQSLPAVSPGDFRDYQQRSRLFDSFAAGSGPSLIGATGALAASDGRETERVDVTPVSANFFSLLGVDPMLGRHFVAEEEAPGGPQVAILSHALWARRFGADQSIVGRRIQLDGLPHTVVGVMPATFNLLLPAEAFLITDAQSLEAAAIRLPPGAAAQLHALHRFRTAEAGRDIRAGAGRDGRHRPAAPA